MWLFGLAFLFIFFLIISIFLFILKLIFKKKIFVLLNIAWWIFFISIPFLLAIVSVFTSKKEVEKDDIYGDYIINRKMCAGKQADWQYNHYRFKITKGNKIFFYITEKENIIKTIEGKVAFTEFDHSPHLKLELEKPKFHILQENPTLYREIWSFYYVFESDKYKNVFFTKGNWKPID
jgi:energy-coupling factor transporter transmembrane protein EcfT